MNARGMTHPGMERHRPISVVEMVWELLVFSPEHRGRILRGLTRKAWWWPLVAIGSVYLLSALAQPTYEGWGMSPGAARLVAAGLLVMSGLALAAVVMCVGSTRYSIMRPSDALMIGAAIPSGVHVCAVLNTASDMALVPSMAVGVAASSAAFAYVRGAVGRVPTPMGAPVWLDDPSLAPALVADCEIALRDASLAPPARAMVEVNLASALVVLAIGADHDDALPRAYELLARALDDAEPVPVYVSAARLVEAMSAMAGRTGDLDGYEQALRLMRDAAGILAQAMPSVTARALLIHGTHLAALSARAARDGEPGRAARLREEALDDLLAVIAGTSRLRTVRLLAELKLAALAQPEAGDLNAAIALCEAALRRLWLRARVHRLLARLVLCDLLLARAEHARASASATAARDVRRATRLCRRLLRPPTSRTAAAQRLPGVLRIGGAPAPEIEAAYRQAFDDLSLLSGSGASDIAAEWAGWTAPDTAEAAHAHWCWLRAVADDARRRPARAEKERRLRQARGLAGRTAEQLLAADRPEDAAVALDLGRAMLLTERMHRDQDGIGARLVAAGELALAARWEEARTRIAQADRDGFAAGAPATGTTLIAGRRFRRRFTTTGHIALGDRERLLREVSRVPGCEDVDAPADYDDLRAAAGDGPLVYLSVTGGGAHAVIVTSDAPRPAVVPLAITAPELDRRVAAWREAMDAGDVSVTLEPLLGWLWETIGAHVTPEVDAGGLVTLITLGGLSLLPVHAMGMTPGDDGVWRDRTRGLVFRYAPNARVLRRARAHARSLDAGALPVLTVGVRKAPGQLELESAECESRGVSQRVGTRAIRPAPAVRGTVLDGMDQCAIWHFACHGIHKPAAPLESSLTLADGELKLRSIFARPAGSGRLAILSACRTALGDEAMVDEVVSFPGALMQAGVAGVISTQWEVGDQEAMLLVLRFFDELADGQDPVRALTRAQRWLCSATNAQICAAMPDVYAAPVGRSGEWLAAWEARRDFAEPRCWAPFSYSGA